MTFFLKNDLRKALFYLTLMMLTGSLSEALLKVFSQGKSLFSAVFSLEVGIFCFLILIKRPKREEFKIHNQKLFFLALSTRILSFSIYFFVLTQMNLFEFRAIFLTCEIYLVLIGIFFLKESVSSFKVVGLVLTFLGAFLTFKGGFSDDFFLNMVLVSYTLMSALTTSLFKIYARQNSSLVYFYALSLSQSLIFGILLYQEQDFLSVSWPIVLIGGLRSIGRYCDFKAISLGPLSLIAPLRYLEMLFVGVFGYLFFNTLPTFLSMTGALLIILGSLIIVYSQKVKERKKVTFSGEKKAYLGK